MKEMRPLKYVLLWRGTWFLQSIPPLNPAIMSRESFFDGTIVSNYRWRLYRLTGIGSVSLLKHLTASVLHVLAENLHCVECVRGGGRPVHLHFRQGNLTLFQSEMIFVLPSIAGWWGMSTFHCDRGCLISQWVEGDWQGNLHTDKSLLIRVIYSKFQVVEKPSSHWTKLPKF